MATNVSPKKSDCVLLRPEDNVAICARHLPAGHLLSFTGRTISLREPVKLGHKVASRDLKKGEPIRKYGQIIGFASEAIPAGSWVHVHNCKADLFERDYAFSSEVPPPPKADRERTFMGYVRADGRVGTRNYVALISTVNCSASTAKLIASAFPKDELERYANVDGLLPITHKGGCAMQYDGPDHHQLNRVLAGVARHPNVGAYVIIGLGCEVGQASHLLKTQRLVAIEGAGEGLQDPAPALVINIQDAGGIRKTIEAGVRAIREILPRADQAKRAPAPAAKLILATQCGGSDGNSGITANPALGVASDLLVAQGGTAVLAETTEIYGAEHLLTRRAVNRRVGEKLVERIRWWEWYTGVFGAEINNNPTPGNKEGGLTTIYEKSLGAVAKGGSTALTEVYQYAEPITAQGFVIMDTPGYDPVSMTGLIAGGANIGVFTTGRGSVYGSKPVPTIKVATNTPLYERMEEDMDLNAGVILEGAPVEEVGRRIFEEMLAVASGKKTKSEEQGLGEEEFIPWSVGPVL
ncbi:MAG: altronate dehydratase [Planctomycetes bacterium]|nr:altronate dehydratase [Planctomycetota bacterium]